MKSTRVGALVAVAAALVAAAPASASSDRLGAVRSSSRVVGGLVYVSAAGTVDSVTVHADGVTSVAHRVGPVSTATASQHVTVYDLVGSGDGAWSAWAESVTSSPTKPDVSDALVLRDNRTGHEHVLAKAEYPVGFAGDRLIVTNGVKGYRLAIGSSPHLVDIHDSSRLLTTYPHGVIDDPVTFPHISGVTADEHVRARSLSGVKRPIHTYADRIKPPRSVELCAVSSDGRQLLVERGDETDFGGVGPSSAIDEFNLNGATDRKRLHHYGTAGAQWRPWTESFAGPTDRVWVTWYRVDAHGVRSVVTRYAGGHWRLVATHAVTAVGNPAGYVVVQPGTFTLVANSMADQHVPTPTSDAVLMHRGHAVGLEIKGSAFVWAAA
jgi:hypothetical protein